MRHCYFCGKTTGLKSVWIEDKKAVESCCLCCFNDPDNGMEECPVSGSDWRNSDYGWQRKIKRKKKEKG